MAFIQRDRKDRRSPKQIALDMSHDLYHRVARRTEPDHPDARMTWRHDGECEWTRANGALS